MLQKLERKEGHQRLARLALELRTKRFPGFDMRFWSSCAACVAANIEEFKTAGLVSLDTSMNGYTPVFGDLCYVPALAAFFEIPHEDAQRLFDSLKNVGLTQSQMANLIDQVLDRLALEAASS